MKIHSSWALLATGAVTVALGAATGASTAALWSDKDSATGELRSGISAFAAYGEGTSPPDLAPNPDDITTFQVPDFFLTLLRQDGTVAVGITIDGREEGHRGMDYQVSGVESGPTVESTTVKVYRTDAATTCETSLTGPEVYSGPLADFTTPSRKLVSSDYGVGDDAAANGRDHLCLVMSYVPDTYQNTATVSGTFNSTPVQATDDWSATLSQEDTTPVVIRFAHTTHRPTAS